VVTPFLFLQLSIRWRLSLVIVAIMLVVFSCRHATEPPPPCSPPVDTTSHSYSWQEWRFSDQSGYSSLLLDVAVLNDSLAYATGELYFQDSAGVYPSTAPLNLARWEAGKGWTFHRLLYHPACADTFRWPMASRAIFSFSASDVWVGMDGSQIASWNGTNETSLRCGLGVYIEKLWGFSASDLWAVGDDGNMAHFDGLSWTQVASGTTTTLLDIWGRGNKVWACGYQSDYARSVLLNSPDHGSSWHADWVNESTSFSKSPFGELAGSVWASEQYLYVAGNRGVFRTPIDSVPNPSNTLLVLPLARAAHRIRGTADNNIAACCDDGSVWHYNGASWKQVVPPGVDGQPLHGIAISDNLIVAVGYDATMISDN
jgi:hypothetical protein